MASQPTPSVSKKMTAFTYHYRCKGYLFPWTGTRNIIHKAEKNMESEAVEDAKQVTGSNDCSVALLQTFYLTVQLGEPYEALLQFPTKY